MASAGSVRWAILTAVGMTSLWPQGALRQMSHTSWTGRDGAPQGIHALAQTTDGYLWLGTLSGLYRFDGLRFTAYIPSPRDPQFNSLDTTALAADANNGLWAGFRVGGISYLKDGRLTNFDERSGLVTGYVGQIVIDGTGKVWAVAAGRLMKLEGARWEDVGARLGLAVGGVQSIFFDRSGHMWIAADGKISVFYRGQTKLAMMPETVKAVTQFLQARDGTIWISDGWKSVRPIGTADAARLTVPIRGTANLIFDTDGYLWIANDYFGVDAVKTAAAIEVEHFERDNGLTSNECRGILEDREGNIWIGTGLGLDRFQQSNFKPFTDVPLKSFPSFAAASDGTVWIGGLGSPLLSIRNGQTTPHGKNRGWAAMYAAPDGAIWQYDYWSGRIWVIRGDEFGQIDAPPGIGRIAAQSITGDRQGALIVSFEYAGIWRRQGEQWEQVPIPGSSQDSVLSLLSDSAGRLWAGFANGQIGLLDRGKYKVFNAGGSVNLGSVMTLYEHSGRIWAGGTNGIVLYTEQGFRRLHPVEGIALRGVSGIVESREKDLWLNSASGIVRISSAEIEHALRDPAYKVQGEIFDFRDGVTGTPAQLRPTPTAIADTTGRLWFSSAGGVVSIDPSAIKRQRSLPQMAVESLRSDGDVQSLAGKKSIPVGPRNLEIDYVGISLASPQRVITAMGWTAKTATGRTPVPGGRPFTPLCSRAGIAFESLHPSGTDGGTNSHCRPKLWYLPLSIRRRGLRLCARSG
jgi:ligand-binding sensor domain-containing protein